MKIISWNVRGINASNKRIGIHQFIESMKVDIILLQEIKLSQDSFQKTIAKWTRWSSSHSPITRASSGLVALWHPLTI